MGNSQSSDAAGHSTTSSSQSHAASSAAPAGRTRERDGSQHRRRPSGHQSGVRKPAVPQHAPSPPPLQTSQHQQERSGHQLPHHNHIHSSNPFAPASPVASTATSTAHVHAHATVSTGPSRSRARSVATPSGIQRVPSVDLIATSMGNAESRPRPASRSTTLPPPPHPPVKDTESPDAVVSQAISSQQQQQQHTAVTPDVTPSEPQDIVFPNGLPASEFSRPPRLPLPIETAPDPGSPILPIAADTTTADVNDAGELGSMLATRRTSMLSSTTVDDEDATDVDPSLLDTGPNPVKVPTRIHYRGAGDEKAVYVTGTFAMWERKFRLHRDPQSGSFSATFPLPTGTHHLKFLVDGDMRTSDELPTTVDFTNALVNYIEVVAPTPPTADQVLSSPTGPMPIPGAAASLGQGSGTVDGAVRPIGLRGDSPASHSARQRQAFIPEENQQDRQKITKPKLPRSKYTNTIPAFLLDLDLYSTPEDERYQRASRASDALPAPPSLPGFMVKSILNITTPQKDDASVLAMPNHTVLNHLATSSIKNGVLATSGTTRYKRKFLTTIMYKPTTDDV